MFRKTFQLLAVSIATMLAQPALAGSGRSSNPALRELSQARSAITRAIAELKRNFHESPETREARLAVLNARFDLQVANNHALDNIRNSPAYKQQQSRVQQAQEQLFATRCDPRASEMLIQTTAVELLQRRSELSRMETDVLSKSAEVASARSAIIDATANLISLQKQFEQGIGVDPKFLAAKDRLDRARDQVRR